MATWIEFIEIPSKSVKTKVWEIRRIDGSANLGRVGWYGRWRKYAFYPYPNCLFEHTCLGDIAKFVEEKTREFWQAKREKRK